MRFVSIFLLIFPLLSFADNLSDSNRLFDFAEKSFAYCFSPANAETFQWNEYLVRYYPETDTYIGTKGEEIYIYGELFGSGLIKMGEITDFIDPEAESNAILAELFSNEQSGVQVHGEGTIVAVLADDVEGERHQLIIVELSSKQTLLISHNIDLAPRVTNFSLGDSLEFFGEYVWNNQGGVIHWTHYDPVEKHIDGWLLHQGLYYQAY